ncbi:MAG TPA: hypothetical protein VJI66_02460 [Candidatus Paceibacterota bacterium]
MNRLKLILAGVLLIFVTASIFRSQERSDRAPVQATSTVSHSEPLTGIQFIPLHTSREEVISQPVSGVLTNLYESLPEWLHGESDFLAVSNFYMRREEMGSMAVGFKPAHEIVISENADQETELAILTEKASANQTLATHAMVEGHLYEELRRELGIEKLAKFKEWEDIERLANALSESKGEIKDDKHRRIAATILKSSRERIPHGDLRPKPTQ